MQTSQYHVFSLPAELLDTLTPRTLLNKPPTRQPSPEPEAAAIASGPRACNICLGVAFLDVDEQRAHFRSDWHRYNVKIRLGGGQPVPEGAFAQLVDALEDSLSGSASSSSEDEDSDANPSDAVAALLHKTKRLITRSRSVSPSHRAAPKTALAWFHSPPSTQLGIYRALFPPDIEPTGYLTALRDMQRPQERTWALFMVAGGHFAGALVRVSRDPEEYDEDEGEGKKKRKQKKPKPEMEVLRHKTFHRYTTRRKQGGSQSVNDNAKGNAKSAGAQLRRYGEQALRDDIRGLLEEWAPDIDSCERIWLRASTSNRRIFVDWEETPIPKGDERLRGFPFPTRRPTQSELTRCLAELTHPKLSHLTEETLRAQDEAYLLSLQPKPRPLPAPSAATPAPQPQKPKLSKADEALRDKWVRVLEMVAKARVEALKAFWEREGEGMGGVDARVPEFVEEGRGRTLLQVAAASGEGKEEVVRWLLEEAGADPTVPVPLPKSGEAEEDEKADGEGNASDPPPASGTRRTAYDLARTKPTRDVFRRAAASFPGKWDWFGAGRVPSALSREKEEQQEEKRKVRRKGLKEKVREREAREGETGRRTPEPEPVQEKEKEKVRDTAGPRKLGGAVGAAEGVAGLTPEMRAKVERERRARAAEARMKMLGGGK